MVEANTFFYIARYHGYSSTYVYGDASMKCYSCYMERGIVNVEGKCIYCQMGYFLPKKNVDNKYIKNENKLSNSDGAIVWSWIMFFLIGLFIGVIIGGWVR